jgi:hypothetical protein
MSRSILSTFRILLVIRLQECPLKIQQIYYKFPFLATVCTYHIPPIHSLLDILCTEAHFQNIISLNRADICFFRQSYNIDLIICTYSMTAVSWAHSLLLFVTTSSASHYCLKHKNSQSCNFPFSKAILEKAIVTRVLKDLCPLMTIFWVTLGRSQ